MKSIMQSIMKSIMKSIIKSIMKSIMQSIMQSIMKSIMKNIMKKNCFWQLKVLHTRGIVNASKYFTVGELFFLDWSIFFNFESKD